MLSFNITMTDWLESEVDARCMLITRVQLPLGDWKNFIENSFVFARRICEFR